jgi:hypothetical protein
VDARTAWRLLRTRPLDELPARVGRFLRREASAARRRWAFRRGAFAVDDVALDAALVAGASATDPFRFPLGVTPRDAAGRTAFAAGFRDQFRAVCDAILRAAEDACAHRFDLLGSGPVELGSDIDWHRDFKTGFRWPPRYCGDLALVDLSNDADVKVPWELSRGYHLVTLGQAFWLTADDRYAQEVVAQLRSWIAANPVLGSVNWGNAMEAAIRVANWLWAVALIRDAPVLGPDERRLVRRSALEHGRFIAENLEVIPGQPASNHYVADLVGLVYLGTLLPELREAAAWREEGLRRLLLELWLQVHEDGVDYERSTSYHRLVAELMASALAVAAQRGMTIPTSAWDRLGLMVEFTRHYTRPDGRAPILGDADDGRLHVLTPAEPDDHRHLLALGGALLDRPEWLAAAGEAWADAAWWRGLDVASAARTEAPPVASRGFVNGGIYVLRDGLDALVVKAAGPAPLTGHGHNDALSFDLSALGRTFIVDSGTFVYTASADARNRFRGTAAHNTVMIDGREMNTIPDELFALGREAAVNVLAWESTADEDVLEAEHLGYTRLPGRPIHRRRFRFDKRRRAWRIEDQVLGEGRHHLAAFLHFAAAVSLEPGPAGGWTATAEDVALGIQCSETLRPRKDWVSRRYGRRSWAWVLHFEREADLPASWWWEITRERRPT